MAAACRYADTGVGAAIAAGSHVLNGKIADFDSAPTSTGSTATGVRPGGLATISEIRYVPAACPSSTNPASIASPPSVVTVSAFIAACLLTRLCGSDPMSR